MTESRKIIKEQSALCVSLTRQSKNSVCSDEEAEAGAAKSVLFFFFPIDLYNSCREIVLE